MTMLCDPNLKDGLIIDNFHVNLVNIQEQRMEKQALVKLWRPTPELYWEPVMSADKIPFVADLLLVEEEGRVLNTTHIERIEEQNLEVAVFQATRYFYQKWNEPDKFSVLLCQEFSNGMFNLGVCKDPESGGWESELFIGRGGKIDEDRSVVREHPTFQEAMILGFQHFWQANNHIVQHGGGTVDCGCEKR